MATPADETQTAAADSSYPDRQRSFYRIDEEGGRLVPCAQGEAQVIVYNSPTIEDEADLLDFHNIDYHTLQSSLDPDELSRLEFEHDHAALIFKRPKSFCADDNFLLKLTSTGVFLYEDYLVVVMPDDAPLFEGRVPFQMHSIQDVILRLLYQSISHFEGHLKAINMLSDSLERRIITSMETRYLLNMFTLEKSLIYILNSINSNAALLDKMKLAAEKLGLDHDQTNILDDIAIENQQCLRRSEIYSQVIADLMDARASIVSHNLNILIKQFTIWTIAIMLANLVVGVFSMNVKLPLPMEVEMWPFYLINILALGSAIGVFWLSRVRKW
ncbi:MAG: magnesium transporter CorA family protein [Chthoniobacterales bacterium]|nr:magnesium transporter CorA family protein [Chthoniobacterales bacterium]